MVKQLVCIFATCWPIATAAVAEGGDADAQYYWPQWRGPLSSGVAPYANPPVEWSETKNIRWKIELPGEGHSTPIVWGDRIFITAVVPYGEALSPRYSGAPGGHDEAMTWPAARSSGSAAGCR